MRYLAIDLGDKRTGLAVGDDVTRLASPVDVLEIPIAQDGGRTLLSALARAIDEHLSRSDELVIGLPLNMDGSEGPRAKLVREFAARLTDHLAETGDRRGVHFHDERLTSADAEWAMGEISRASRQDRRGKAAGGLTRGQKKAKRDALAASAILRDFLDQAPEP